MLVFRRTQRVVRRFKLQLTDEPHSSTGVLGDWYANLQTILASTDSPR